MKSTTVFSGSSSLPRQLAALYNERYPLQDLLQLEQNGMAFSPSVPERTPSTAITNDGRAWVDFSARSIQPDGKRDGGDALELEARRNGESKAAKPATLRKVAHTLVREAREALEDAARSWRGSSNLGGTDHDGGRLAALPLTPCRNLQQLDTASRGVTGFQHVGMSTQATQEQLPSERQRNRLQ